MEKILYRDIKMSNDDITLLEDNQAELIFNQDVIIQDLIHALRESGLLINLIAERNLNNRLLIFNKIKILVEDDTRIVPGSCIIEDNSQILGIKCDSYDFGKLKKIDVEVK